MNFLTLIRKWWRKPLQSLATTDDTVTNLTIHPPLPGDIHIHWHFNSSSPKPAAFLWNTQGGLTVESSIWGERPSAAQREVLEQNKMLEEALSRWQFGDWENLVSLEIEMIEKNPHRAKLALLIGAAHQQIGDVQIARQYIQQAQHWGCDKRLIGKILIAGVHNNLGKAASVLQEHTRALDHFQKAIRGGVGDERLYCQARQHAEMARLSANMTKNPVGANDVLVEA
jgi:tetratricopeptide (TPR) repeat protein